MCIRDREWFPLLLLLLFLGGNSGFISPWLRGKTEEEKKKPIPSSIYSENPLRNFSLVRSRAGKKNPQKMRKFHSSFFHLFLSLLCSIFCWFVRSPIPWIDTAHSCADFGAASILSSLRRKGKMFLLLNQVDIRVEAVFRGYIKQWRDVINLEVWFFFLLLFLSSLYIPRLRLYKYERENNDGAKYGANPTIYFRNKKNIHAK